MQAMNNKEYLKLSNEQKTEIAARVSNVLLKEDNIKFAYLFGSFLANASFRDVDIGIYLEQLDKKKYTAYELSLSEKLAKVTNLPFDRFDIKILNDAPFYFLNNIFKKGKLLACRSTQLLDNLIESSSLEAVSEYEFSQQSLRELITS